MFLCPQMCKYMEPLFGPPANQPQLWLVIFVVAVMGNGDLLVALVKTRDQGNTCLVNMAVGNILAVACLPINYMYQFHDGCRSQLPTCATFWILRDIATGVQMFSVAVFSALRLCGSQTRRYDPEAASTCKGGIAGGSGATSVQRCITIWSQTFAIWIMAVCYSLPAAMTSHPQYYIQNGDAFEDADTIHTVISHCLSHHIIPMALTIFFYILSEIRGCNSPDKLQAKDDGRLVFWIICTITLNYVPLHSWLVYSWSQYRLVTLAVVDFATYFPMYSTATWIPVVLYFAMPTYGANCDKSQPDPYPKIAGGPFSKNKAGGASS
jgi:hypothetical protein